MVWRERRIMNCNLESFYKLIFFIFIKLKRRNIKDLMKIVNRLYGDSNLNSLDWGFDYNTTKNAPLVKHKKYQGYRMELFLTLLSSGELMIKADCDEFKDINSLTNIVNDIGVVKETATVIGLNYKNFVKPVFKVSLDIISFTQLIKFVGIDKRFDLEKKENELLSRIFKLLQKKANANNIKIKKRGYYWDYAITYDIEESYVGIIPKLITKYIRNQKGVKHIITVPYIENTIVSTARLDKNNFKILNPTRKTIKYKYKNTIDLESYNIYGYETNQYPMKESPLYRDAYNIRFFGNWLRARLYEVSTSWVNSYGNKNTIKLMKNVLDSNIVFLKNIMEIISTIPLTIKADEIIEIQRKFIEDGCNSDLKNIIPDLSNYLTKLKENINNANEILYNFNSDYLTQDKKYLVINDHLIDKADNLLKLGDIYCDSLNVIDDMLHDIEINKNYLTISYMNTIFDETNMVLETIGKCSKIIWNIISGIHITIYRTDQTITCLMREYNEKSEGIQGLTMIEPYVRVGEKSGTFDLANEALDKLCKDYTNNIWDGIITSTSGINHYSLLVQFSLLYRPIEFRLNTSQRLLILSHEMIHFLTVKEKITKSTVNELISDLIEAFEEFVFNNHSNVNNARLTEVRIFFPEAFADALSCLIASPLYVISFLHFSPYTSYKKEVDKGKVIHPPITARIRLGIEIAKQFGYKWPIIEEYIEKRYESLKRTYIDPIHGPNSDDIDKYYEQMWLQPGLFAKESLVHLLADWVVKMWPDISLKLSSYWNKPIKFFDDALFVPWNKKIDRRIENATIAYDFLNNIVIKMAFDEMLELEAKPKYITAASILMPFRRPYYPVLRIYLSLLYTNGDKIPNFIN